MLNNTNLYDIKILKIWLKKAVKTAVNLISFIIYAILKFTEKTICKFIKAYKRGFYAKGHQGYKDIRLMGSINLVP